MLIGTLANSGAIIAGCLIGLILGNIFPARLQDTVTKGLGLSTLFLGITGLLDGENALITIVSMALGAIAGELLDLDGAMERFAERVGKRFHGTSDRNALSAGFSVSLLFCVGAMTIMGALNDGLTGDHTILFTKATLDFFSAMIFASSLGPGVLLAAVVVFVVEGGIACLASVVAPVLQYSDAVIPEMSAVGSLLIVALGLNLLGITKLKVMNYLPAIFLPILLCLFM